VTPQILLEDGPVLVLNKPTGLATEAPPGIPSLVEWVKGYLKEKFQKPGNVYLGVPHRLDRPVSGVVVMTRNSKAAARIAEQFRDRQVKKTYLAVVERPPDPPRGSLVHWLTKNTEGKAEIVEPRRADAKECFLRYETLGVFPSGALLEIELGTGRYHQIRVQMSASGWPVVGDVPYGGKPLNTPLSHKESGDRDHARNENGPPKEGPLLLHARRLTFFHPIRYDLVSASAPLPGHWPADVRAVVADVETGTNRPPLP
jgi:23S rRNA pseudouridine1911/1915/1917 synthase